MKAPDFPKGRDPAEQEEVLKSLMIVPAASRGKSARGPRARRN